MNTPTEILCRYLPIEFATFLNYCRDLYFIEKPDYNCLRQSFRKLFFRKYSNTNSNLFDWTILANKSSSSSGKMIKEYKIDSSQEQKNTSRKDPKSKDTKSGDKSSSGKMIKEYKIDSSREQKNTSRKDPKSKDTKSGDKSSSGKMIKEYKIDSSREQKNTSRKDPKSKDTKSGDKFKHRYDYPHADTPQDKHSVKVLEIATYI